MMVILVYPVFVFVIRGQFVPMLPMFVPGIDESSSGGFAMLSVLHVFWTIQGAVGLLFADMFYSLILLHIWPMVDIFGSMFEQLNEAIVQRPKLEKSFVVRMWLRNIIMAHREICS